MQPKEMAERNRACFQVSIFVKMTLERCKRKARIWGGGCGGGGGGGIKDINR